MRKAWMIFCLALLIPSLCSAAEPGEKKRGIFSGILHLEGRGLANVFLFPAEWGHLPKAELVGVFGTIPVVLTHMGGRIFSGICDIVVLPLAYPFTRYDDSLPVRMGWTEYPWPPANDAFSSGKYVRTI